jgi:hypothetical protein
MIWKDFVILGLTCIVAGQAFWLWVAAKRIDTVEAAMADVEEELTALARKFGWNGTDAGKGDEGEGNGRG